jgi:hypothetical protein
MGAMLGAICVLCATWGDTTDSQEGDATAFHYPYWTPGLVLLGGIAAFLTGLLLRKMIPRWGWVLRLGWMLMIVGPVACAVLAPSLLMQKVAVNNEGFSIRRGIWFAPTVQTVRYGDLRGIEMVAETHRDRYGRLFTTYNLICHRKTGGSEIVPGGTLVKEGGAAYMIVQTAGAQGIPISGKW